MDEREFEETVSELETLRRDRDRAAGARDELRKRLKDEYGCSSLAEAEREEAAAKVKLAKLEKKYERVLADLKRKWGDKLGGGRGD